MKHPANAYSLVADIGGTGGSAAVYAPKCGRTTLPRAAEIDVAVWIGTPALLPALALWCWIRFGAVAESGSAGCGCLGAIAECLVPPRALASALLPGSGAEVRCPWVRGFRCLGAENIHSVM